MKLKFCLIVCLLLLANCYTKADELLNIYLSNSDMSPVRIEISSISSIKFNSNRFTVNTKDNTSEKFYFSDVTKITFDNGKTSIETIESTSSASIYPNPAKNNLSIKGTNEMHGTDIYIYSMTGVLVAEHSQWKGETIDVSHLNPGVYFVNINSTTLKFVKQ